MATVFLVQEPLKRDRHGQVVSRFDLSKLEPYGRLSYLCSWGELREGIDIAQLTRKFRDKLQGFTDKDYIVPVGNPALIGLATLVAADINEGRVKMLDWVRDDNRYREIAIDMEWEPLYGAATA